MFLSYQKVVADDTVKTRTALSIPAGASGAQIQAVDNDIRYTMDGSTTPATDVGMILLKGDSPKEFEIADIRRIKFTRGTNSNADLTIHYVGRRVVAAADPNSITVTGAGNVPAGTFLMLSDVLNGHQMYGFGDYVIAYAEDLEGIADGWFLGNVGCTKIWQSATPLVIDGTWLPLLAASGNATVSES